MSIIQLFFRDSFSIMNQEKFRDNQIDYYFNKFVFLPTDGRERKCKLLKEDKTKLMESKLCEGFTKIENTKYKAKVDKCKVVNDVKDWRKRIDRIPTDVLDGDKGCGMCFNNKQVLYGDSNGPFTNIGKKVCGEWIKPGELGVGGSGKKKNIFGKYPNPINKFLDLFRNTVNKGVKHDAVKLYEQEICAKVENCGQLMNYTRPDGTALCGFCFAGRKGDGRGVGMVRKGGRGKDRNEPKYDDDYCPWPREIKKNMDNTYSKTEFYKTPNAREFKIWRERGDKNTSEKAKLFGSLGQCKLAESLFPCFANFPGDLKPKHSDECYRDMWSYLVKPKGCDGDIMSRVPRNLPRDATYGLPGGAQGKVGWHIGYIPMVESAILKIPHTSKTSHQYAPTYNTNTRDHNNQKLNSALLNARTCNPSKLPNPCEERFRKREYNYPRPKACIDDILVQEGLPKTHASYNPVNQSTWPYYWAVYHDNTWREGVHYDWSNDTFKAKLREKKNIYNKSQNLKQANYINYNHKSRSLHEYDKVLLAALYLYGNIPSRDIFWQDNDGGMSKPWVKMCWEDFRDEMKKVWAPNNNNFITKDGRVDIRQSTDYYTLKQKVLGSSSDNSVHLSKYIHSNGMVLQISLDDDRYLMKNAYEHPYFPFWRFLPKDYYITNLYKNIQTKENRLRKASSCKVHLTQQECDSNKTCTWWKPPRGFSLYNYLRRNQPDNSKCMPKLELTESLLNYRDAQRICGRKYGGKLVKVSGDNLEYVKDFVYKNYTKLLGKLDAEYISDKGGSPKDHLDECVGDCDRDSDCRGSWETRNNICFHRHDKSNSYYTNIPGCRETLTSVAFNDTSAIPSHDICVNPNKTKMVKKYTGKWPHCSKNQSCHSDIYLYQMKEKCRKDGYCTGFSWTSGKNSDYDRGSGCLKVCWGGEGRHGYGNGSYDYYEKADDFKRKNAGARISDGKYMNVSGETKSNRYSKKYAICQLDYSK